MPGPVLDHTLVADDEIVDQRWDGKQDSNITSCALFDED